MRLLWAVALVAGLATPARADRILFREGYDLFAIGSDGKGRTHLAPGIQVLDAYIGPDGTTLVGDYADPPNLYALSPGGEPPRPIGHGRDVVFSVDGKHIAFGCNPPETPKNDLSSHWLCTASIDGSDVRRLYVSPAELGLVPLGYSADGTQVFFSERTDAEETLFEVPAVTAGADPARKLFTVALQKPGALAPDVRRYAWTTPGVIHVRTLDAAAGGADRLLKVAGLLDGTACTWSPDSTRLACVVARRRGRAQASSVETYEVDRGVTHVLVHEGNGRPRWSPDGGSILYARSSKDYNHADFDHAVSSWKGGPVVVLTIAPSYEDLVLAWGH